MTEAEVRVVAQEAADRAVSRVFERLGVDVQSSDQIFELRQDLEFLAQARKGTTHGMKAFFSALLAALGMAAWLGFNALFGRG